MKIQELKQLLKDSMMKYPVFTSTSSCAKSANLFSV